MKFLTVTEMKEMIPILEKLEQDTLDETGVRQISGGFAEASLFDYNGDAVDVELKWGVKSDVQDTLHIERYMIQRQKPYVVKAL